jgi:hypothetical protein
MCCFYFPCETTVVAILPPAPSEPVAVFSPTVISLHLHHHIHHSPNVADQVVALSLLVATSPAQLKYCYILSEATAPQTGTQLNRNRDPAFNPFPAQVICKINQEMQDMIFRMSQVP